MVDGYECFFSGKVKRTLEHLICGTEGFKLRIFIVIVIYALLFQTFLQLKRVGQPKPRGQSGMSQVQKM